MITDLDTYRRDLILALRVRDVPGDRIGEIVAEVESHVADTGEDPHEAFGPAREYAATTTGLARSRWGWTDLAVAVAAGAAGWLLAGGLLGLVSGTSLGPLRPWAAVALGLAVAAPTVVHLRRTTSAVRDPRTGRDMAPFPRWAPWLLGGLLALPVAVAAVVLVAFS